MSRRPSSSHDRGRRTLLGGLGAAAFLGILGSALRGVFGSPAPPTARTGQGAPLPARGGSSPATSSTVRSSTTPTTEATTSTTAPTEATTDAATVVAGGPGTVLVIEKAGWGAAPEASGFVEHEIMGIVVHHTAVVLGSNADAPARARGHQGYHQEQGWADIAYHMMIDRNGNIYEGRPLWARGDTFTDYDPTGFFLPCLEGDFNSESPSAAQLESLAALCAWAVDRWGVDPAAISGHRDEASTTCPGGNLYPHVAGGDLANRVHELVEAGPHLTYLRGQAALDRVATIEAGG